MTTNDLAFEVLGGERILPHIDALSRLRIEVFRAFPYLYDGDPAYEASYIRTYAASRTAAIIVARDGDVPVGASTCLALPDETENVIAPFRAAGIDPSTVFYFGESVLLPQYRGRGAGVAFFEAREAHARSFDGIELAAFCSVRREPEHPARPADWVPLDAFWRHRGFAPRPDLTCTMPWREVGQSEETDHTLAFWVKSLTRPAA